jgi:hypothetical protein
MNYATWKLNFTDPNYGTGPEDKIAELGFGAEGAWVAGEVENGGTILGYVTEPVDETELTTWELTNITRPPRRRSGAYPGSGTNPCPVSVD